MDKNDLRLSIRPDHVKYIDSDWKFRGITSRLKPTTAFLPSDYDKTDLIADKLIYDQGYTSTCTSNAASSAWIYAAQHAFSTKVSKQFGMWENLWFKFNFSRLWLDNQAKAIDPWPETNPGDMNGTDIRSVLKVMSWGFVSEDLIPFSESTKIKLTPADEAEIVKQQQIAKIKSYRTCLRPHRKHMWQVPDINLTKRAIMQNGCVIIGAQLPVGFYDVGASGLVPIHHKDAGGQHANHAMILTGWNTNKKSKRTLFRGINSWGKDWGDNGMFLWDAEHLQGRCFAAWTLDSIHFDYNKYKLYFNL